MKQFGLLFSQLTMQVSNELDHENWLDFIFKSKIYHENDKILKIYDDYIIHDVYLRHSISKSKI